MEETIEQRDWKRKMKRERRKRCKKIVKKNDRYRNYRLHITGRSKKRKKINAGDAERDERKIEKYRRETERKLREGLLKEE